MKMKTVLIRYILVLCALLLANSAYAADEYCDPDSDGKPICQSISNGQTYRNFWDPTRYWVCNGSGEPISKRCPSGTAFSGETNKCVPWIDWVWVPPCPEVN